MELTEEQIYRVWFIRKGINHTTQRLYKYIIQLFTERTNMSLTELYKMYKQVDNIETSELGLIILSFFEELKEDENISSNYMKTVKSGLMSFCSAYNFTFPEIHFRVNGKPENYRRNLKNSEIRMLMNYGSIRDKAVISMGAMSGMRSMEIRMLTHQQIVRMINDEISTNYSNITDVIENKDTVLDETDCYPLTTKSWKTNHMYTTYIPCETLELVFKYYKTLSYDKIYDTKFLFRKVDNTPFSRNTQRGIHNMIANRVNFDAGRQKGQYSLFATHQLRRYFYNMVLNHVGVIYADLWTGHKLPKIRAAYTRVSDEMTDKYRECLPYLSLNDNNISNFELKEYEMLKEQKDVINKSYVLLEKMNMLENL